jgi:hypothetical protein
MEPDLASSEPIPDLPLTASRRIDLDLLSDTAAYAAEVKARNAARTEKHRQKAETFHGNANAKAGPPSVELAATIDAKTGQSVRLARRISIPDENTDPHFVKPPRRFGKLVSVPGSFADIAVNLEKRLNVWGRGIDCTVPYGDKRDTRVPKYALKITFWAPGVEKHEEKGGDWTQSVLSLRRRPVDASGSTASRYERSRQKGMLLCLAGCIPVT